MFTTFLLPVKINWQANQAKRGERLCLSFAPWWRRQYFIPVTSFLYGLRDRTQTTGREHPASSGHVEFVPFIHGADAPLHNTSGGSHTVERNQNIEQEVIAHLFFFSDTHNCVNVVFSLFGDYSSREGWKLTSWRRTEWGGRNGDGVGTSQRCPRKTSYCGLLSLYRLYR